MIHILANLPFAQIRHTKQVISLHHNGDGLVEGMLEWFKRYIIRTEEEIKQRERAMAAYCETLGKFFMLTSRPAN